MVLLCFLHTRDNTKRRAVTDLSLVNKLDIDFTYVTSVYKCIEQYIVMHACCM
jgi:hypothetical protein